MARPSEICVLYFLPLSRMGPSILLMATTLRNLSSPGDDLGLHPACSCPHWVPAAAPAEALQHSSACPPVPSPSPLLLQWSGCSESRRFEGTVICSVLLALVRKGLANTTQAALELKSVLLPQPSGLWDARTAGVSAHNKHFQNPKACVHMLLDIPSTLV